MVVDEKLGVWALTTDEMLLATEWLARTVDMLLDVSEEIVDSGRGMYSTEFANRARGRG